MATLDPQSRSEVGDSFIQAGFSQIGAGHASYQNNPYAAQAVTKAYSDLGTNVASTLRDRYFREEWKQIKDVRIKPLENRLMEAAQVYQRAMAVTDRPVSQIMTPEETQLLADSMGPDPTVEPIQTGTTVEGKPKTELMQQPAPPSFNPAMANAGQMGATYTKDMPSIIDPDTGMPIDVTSNRAQQIIQQFTFDFWGEFQRVNLETMDVLGEYASNPYASTAADGIMKNITGIAGSAVTGKTDPMQQRQWWEERQKFQADMDMQGQQQEAALLNLDISRGQLEGDLADARTMAANPDYADMFGKGLAKKLTEGKQLTQKEATTVAGIRNMIREREMSLAKIDLQSRTQRQKAGMELIPVELYDDPDQWLDHLRTDDNRTSQYSESIKTRELGLQQQLMSGGPEYVAEQMAAAGIQDPDGVLKQKVSLGMWEDPGVVSAMEMLVNTPEAIREANLYADTRMIGRVEAAQPELTPVIDQAIEQAITMRNRDLARNGLPMMSAQEENELRMDRSRTAVWAFRGQRPTEAATPPVERAGVDAYRREVGRVVRDRVGQQQAAESDWANENFSLLGDEQTEDEAVTDYLSTPPSGASSPVPDGVRILPPTEEGGAPTIDRDRPARKVDAPMLRLLDQPAQRREDPVEQRTAVAPHADPGLDTDPGVAPVKEFADRFRDQGYVGPQEYARRREAARQAQQESQAMDQEATSPEFRAELADVPSQELSRIADKIELSLGDANMSPPERARAARLLAAIRDEMRGRPSDLTRLAQGAGRLGAQGIQSVGDVIGDLFEGGEKKTLSDIVTGD